MAKASELKAGNFINFKGELLKIDSYVHRTPGNLRAFYQASMRNVKSSKLVEHRFRPDEEVQKIRVETKEYQYLYSSQGELILMDLNSYEQLHVPVKMLEHGSKFLTENMQVSVAMAEDGPVSVSLPGQVELKVANTECAVRGNTSTNATKLATLENGTEIQVPLFIKEGELIKIDTSTGLYLERIKNK